MEYSVLTATYEKLEATSSKLKKAEILAELFKKTPSNELQKVVLLVQGIVYPKFTGLELGVAVQMMMRVISKATGFSAEEIEKKFAKIGDLGLTAEECMKAKKQKTLLQKKLTVDFIFKNLQQLAEITGAGSQDRKLSLVAELLTSSKPNEAKYIVRTILQELRIGVAEGIVRDAVVNAFLFKEGTSKEEKAEMTDAVEYAWNIVSDFGEVVVIARERGVDGLRKVRVQLGKPVQVMLGLAAESIENIVKDFGKVAAEYKYDGARVMCQKQGNRIWIFTRRLENVTTQFPDIVEMCRKNLKADECIVEGEALGIDKKTGLPVPFQTLGQRIQRKYDIEQLAKEVPIQVNLFDVIFVDGKTLFDKPFEERRKILEKIVKIVPEKFQLAKQIVSDDVKVLEKFYKEALDAGQEGLMLKVLSTPYTFGRHVETMYKIKGVMENLDLVIIGATWGEGARANWLTSFELACRDPDTGKFLSLGMMSTGLNEEEYGQMTKELKKLITHEKGKAVKVRPKIVLEVGYQEIQKSPHYESGFGLRFPRFIRLREDKSPIDADTIDRVKKLYQTQGKSS